MTRYERVQEILDRAAGSSAADYGGRGRFWHLPLTQLLEVVWGADDRARRRGQGRMLSRGERRGGRAAAALSRPRRRLGLRGQPPCDGAQLPRLPWGGAVVAEAEIAFISDWIDDDCPADDREIASFALSGTVSAPVLAGSPLRTSRA